LHLVGQFLPGQRFCIELALETLSILCRDVPLNIGDVFQRGVPQQHLFFAVFPCENFVCKPLFQPLLDFCCELPFRGDLCVQLLA
jgi:hypothetical protein